MNDAVNFCLYTQIIRFQLSSKEEESLFQAPDLLQQRAIERWAKSLALVYEYDAGSRRARVRGLDVPLERKDNSTQTDHSEERGFADKAGDEDGMLGDDSRGENTPLFLTGGIGGERISKQISDGAPQIRGLQPDAKSSQNASKMRYQTPPAPQFIKQRLQSQSWSIILHHLCHHLGHQQTSSLQMLQEDRQD
jgi:hypothetical protein